MSSMINHNASAQALIIGLILLIDYLMEVLCYIKSTYSVSFEKDHRTKSIHFRFVITRGLCDSLEIDFSAKKQNNTVFKVD